MNLYIYERLYSMTDSVAYMRTYDTVVPPLLPPTTHTHTQSARTHSAHTHTRFIIRASTTCHHYVERQYHAE